ncbi:MAG: ribonuclease R [Bacteroidetes bacterium]|nr:ribonuclease R [Bacteroidota bacterium]
MGKKSSKISTANSSNIIRSVMEVFQQNPFSSFNYKQLSARLGLNDRASKDMVRLVVERLFMGKELVESKRGKFQINTESERFKKEMSREVIGRVDMKQTGKAYIIPEDGSEDIFVAAENTHHALHGDTVRVSLFPMRKGHKRDGQIKEIIKRHKRQFVGTIEASKNFAFLIPDNPSVPVEILIQKSDLNGARNGEKVVALITEWPEHAQNPFGRVIQILGKPGDNHVEMQAILAEYDFPLSFSGKSEAEAEKIPEELPQEEIRKRRDFRTVFTITIDPEDAKDFDDAVSLKKLPNGHWEVGVHIADVSYYVQKGSEIDKEAFERGTSVYMVHRTIPMLPERLSNQLCSLQPDKDRLCFSAVFEFDEQGKIYNEWFGKTVIHSCRRFAYEEVQVIIETAKGEYAGEIGVLNRIALKLREERFKKGSFNFETQEVRFRLDEKGRPLSIYIREMKEANKLIEDFMLLANRKVAEWVGKQKPNVQPKTFVYRVHDKPNPEKLEIFTQLVERLGFSLKLSTKKSMAHSFNQLFHDIKGTGAENMVESVAIRTMAKAFYTTKNIGHYGLAFPYYTHFTSPIRRYPDLIVHRLFQDYLDSKPSAHAAEYEIQCEHASDMEKRAADAERASVKYKQAEYMLDKIGQEFDALISGVSKWGIFAEIVGTKCEGMIKLRDLDDDYYYLDEENFRVIGQRHGIVYKLGDPIKIRVKKIDLSKKQMDYIIL